MRNDLGGPPQLVVWRCFTMTKSGGGGEGKKPYGCRLPLILDFEFSATLLATT